MLNTEYKKYYNFENARKNENTNALVIPYVISKIKALHNSKLRPWLAGETISLVSNYQLTW